MKKLLMNKQSCFFLCFMLFSSAMFAAAENEEIVLTKGMTAKVRLEAHYFEGQEVKGTGEKVAVTGYYTEYYHENDSRLFDGISDAEHGLATHFWSAQGKRFTVELDLGRVCDLTSFRLSIPNGKTDNNWADSCSFEVSSLGTDKDQFSAAGAFGNPNESFAQAPENYDFTGTFENVQARYVRVVIASYNSATMTIGELEIKGRELKEQPTWDIPAGVRFEAENLPPPYTSGAADAFGQMAVVSMSLFGELVLPDALPAPLHIWLRYACQEEQTFTFICNDLVMDMPATDSLKWVYAGEASDKHLMLAFKLLYQPRIAGGLDSIVLLEDGTLNPNELPQKALQAMPAILPPPGIVETLLKENPDMPPAEFGHRVIAEYRMKPPKQVAPFVSEDGAIQWRGKPIFPITFYGSYPNDSRNRLAAINATMDGRPRQVGDNRDLYRIGGMGTLRANDMLARQLEERAGDPDMTMYYISDEPQGCGITVKELQYLNALHKAVDPATPTFINVAAGGYHESVVSISDYVGVDHYPIPAGRIFDIANSIDCTRQASGGKPVIFVAQTFNWADAGGGPENRFPTCDEISAMTWLPIIYGCRGVWYYDFGIRSDRSTCIVDEHPVEWQRIVEVIDMMRAIEPQLVGPETEFPGTVTCDGSREHPLAWRLAIDHDRTEAVLIVCNSWDEERMMKIDWALPDVRLKACLKHGVTAKENTLHFAPFGTGVFRIKTSELGNVRTLTPVEALHRVNERLNRPISRNEISLWVNAPAYDLQDTWQSRNHFEAATIRATAEDIQIYVKQRYVKPTEFSGIKRDGNVWSDPCIELFFGTPDASTYAYCALNVKNVQADMKSGEGVFDFSVDYEWESSVKTNGEFAEYTVRIPWKTIAVMTGLEPKSQFSFNLASCSSQADWVGLTGGTYHSPKNFGIIEIEEKK